MMRVITMKGLLLLMLSYTNAQTTDVRLSEALSSFNIQTLLEEISALDLDSECNDHLGQYLMGLYSGEGWAQRMFDSSAKIPDGVLMGNLKVLGQFEECIDVQDSGIDFVGQHCMMDLSVSLGGPVKYYEKNNLLQPLAAKEGFALPLFYGVCIPSSCNASEYENILNGLFNSSKVLTNMLSVTVDPQNCWTSEPRALSSGDWVVVGFLVTMGVITICSSLYDIIERFYYENDKPHPLLSSFSIYSNGKYLFKISDGAGQMKALHGLRTLSMSWVVLCHAYAYTMYGPAVNIMALSKYLLDGNHVLVTNGYVAVDSFFFMSGLLVCFVFFRDMAKKGSYDVPLGYIHRYIRLTPPFAVMILLQVTILLYIGNGPLWHTTNDEAARVCRDNWWSGLLYVQNFVNPNSTCLGQSWYLSADMQMYWVSPLILYPMYFWPKIGPVYILFGVLVAAFTNFAVAYNLELGPSTLITTDTIKQFAYDYVPFYTRMAPWLIGVALGYLICGIQAKKIHIKLSKLEVAFGWFCSTGICLTCIYSILSFNNNDTDDMGMPFNNSYEYSVVAASFYLAFHRVGWALGLSWIVFACIQGYGGPVNTFLSWSVFQPLGKLSYCAFLIHVSIQLYRTGMMRTNLYIGDLQVVYFFLGDWVLANLISIPFTLVFEIPFMNIDRYLFRNVQIFPFPRAKKAGMENENKMEAGIANPTFSKSES